MRAAAAAAAIITVEESGMLSPWLARYAAPAVAALAIASAPQARPAAAVTAAPSWDVRTSYRLTDRCGGVSGWVQWGTTNILMGGIIPGSDPVIQTYGEVWENPASCGGSGVHYVKLVWYWPGQAHWSSAGSGAAGPGQT